MEKNLFTEIEKLTMEISKLYPIDSVYSSRATMYAKALNAGAITIEEYEKAANYYGDLWTYVGD